MKEYIQVRKELIEYLKRDQFGPYTGPDESLPENPLFRYMVGILNPQGVVFDVSGDDGGQTREPVSREDDSEPGLRMSNTVAPSSYGLTFFCKSDVIKLRAFIEYGSYRHEKTSPGKDKNITEIDESLESEIWKRKGEKKNFDIIVDHPGDKSYPIIEKKLSMRVRARKVDSSGFRSVTVSVVNEQKWSKDLKFKTKAERSFFQVCFGVEGIDGKTPFVARKDFNGDSTISEENSVRLLYRKVHNYATGHGCAVDWFTEHDQENACRLIKSTFVPYHTIYPMVQPDDVDLPVYSIKFFAQNDGIEAGRLLSSIPDSYEEWIKKKESRISNLDESLRPQAKEHLKQCQNASSRIRKGIMLIESDQTVGNAFKLMHMAMLHQIARSAWFKAGRPGEGPSMGDEHAWYPFQMAFILQCLESIVNQKSSERELVDLLWFPTGGGKTEAYLGIIAFSIFLRRLRSLTGVGNDNGTVALMRYTLRLLTVDQFDRASLLACACEKIRREGPYGLSTTAPISIGLWVGGEASPNRWQDARKDLEAINAGGEEPKIGNPVKVRKCPWCKNELGSADYSLPDEAIPMLIKCPSEKCDFNNGLPVWVIDSDVYSQRPSLIIGTVDKFARIPWVKDVSKIFGCDGLSGPPDIIIQDELHLISGPLGTMVGLYETAVDVLCGAMKDCPPKVIASTATIRNAEYQVLNLFCRKVSQFPPPGLEYSDSFFARENTDHDLPGRMYLGIFTPGTSPTTALVRTFAMLLHGAKKVTCRDTVRDAYWTLMSYFNSLRELGGASVQVEDDVNDYLKMCAERDGDPLSLRQVHYKAELTGRVDSTELEEIRGNLWCRFPDEDCLDVVLATNMISVGLDVPRLGLMSIVGQPKTTAEYIQATSRIGRRYPGLVVTIYNWTRSRDRSHFERFKSYHSKLYSEVEAMSVTPFSSRARDRGLHAVLFAMVRHLIDGMQDNESACRFDKNSDEVKKIVDFIIQRVKRVDNEEARSTEKAVVEILDRWASLADTTELVYQKKRKSRDDRVPLMVAAGEISDTSRSFPTLNSLRNIDPAAGLNLEN